MTVVQTACHAGRKAHVELLKRFSEPQKLTIFFVIKRQASMTISKLRKFRLTGGLNSYDQKLSRNERGRMA